MNFPCKGKAETNVAKENVQTWSIVSENIQKERGGNIY